MKTPVIELKGISKYFSGIRVLNNVDLTVNPGEVLCLVGENGSGKSTLIKIVSGVFAYEEGLLRINGKAYPKITPEQSINEGIQVIYQDFSIFHDLTVAENITMSLQVQKRKVLVDWKSNEKLAKKVLEKIGIDIDLYSEVGQLPVAQKQIVAICRAIAQDAKLIIMDEPTTALTKKEIDKLFTIIEGLKAQGISIIFVSHKLEEVFAVCDRIAVLRSGELVVDEQVDTFPKEKLVYYMTGKEIEEKPFKFECNSAEVLIEARNISRVGSFEDVSFKLREGEILAVTGQLGSGRTELALALFGVEPIENGQIIINNKEARINSIKDALKNGIAYLPEDRLTEGLLLTRSISDNISSTIVDKLKNKAGIIPSKGLADLAGYWMTKLGITDKPHDTLASQFSGGNQQRIVLAKWLAVKPKIFILNCPTMGVDVKSKSEIHTIMKELAIKGLAIIMMSDDVGEILATSNRVLVMNAGRVVFQGDTQELTQNVLTEKILAG
jgi:simple sugar transport system ATP-binding protein